MQKNEVLERVQEIFRDVFDDASLVITEQTKASDIEECDSMMNITLVSAIEKDCSMRFALGELQELKNVGDMLDLILSKQG